MQADIALEEELQILQLDLQAAEGKTVLHWPALKACLYSDSLPQTTSSIKVT